MLIIKQDQERLEEMEKQVNILDHMLTQHIISQDEFDFEIGELKVEYREIHRRNRELNESKEEQSTSDIYCKNMFDCSNKQTDNAIIAKNLDMSYEEMETMMFDSNVHQMIEEIESECRTAQRGDEIW